MREKLAFSAISPKGYWDHFGNHRKFFDNLGSYLSINRWQDWYHINSVDVIRNGGSQLLKTKYKGSLISALTTVYPDHPWQYFKFARFPKEDIDPSLHLIIFDQIGKHLGIKELDDWYQVKQHQVLSVGAGRLLDKFYRGWLAIALISIYGNFNWKIWKFDLMPLNFWADKLNQKLFFDQLQVEYNIKHWEDWYQVRVADVKKIGGGGILVRYHGDSLIRALKSVYPEHDWPDAKAQIKQVARKNVAFKSQRHLFNQLKEMFPSSELFMDFMLENKLEKERFELDIAIPSLNIAFEYQGIQHYKEGNMFDSLEPRKLRDEKKKKACKESGITLIEIPYWWDSNPTSLHATIHSLRPDIIGPPPSGSELIPLSDPTPS